MNETLNLLYGKHRLRNRSLIEKYIAILYEIEIARGTISQQELMLKLHFAEENFYYMKKIIIANRLVEEKQVIGFKGVPLIGFQLTDKGETWLRQAKALLNMVDIPLAIVRG